MHIRLKSQVFAILLIAAMTATLGLSQEVSKDSSSQSRKESKMVDRESYLLELSEVLVPLIWQNPPPEITNAERTFICIWQLESEVNNGGFHQYYYNSAGDLARETPAAFQMIGADQTAEIVRRANAKFPDGPPPDRDDRQSKLDVLPEDSFEDLDGRFLEYEEDLSELLFRFVEKNRISIRGA